MLQNPEKPQAEEPQADVRDAVTAGLRRTVYGADAHQLSNRPRNPRYRHATWRDAAAHPTLRVPVHRNAGPAQVEVRRREASWRADDHAHRSLLSPKRQEGHHIASSRDAFSDQ